MNYLCPHLSKQSFLRRKIICNKLSIKLRKEVKPMDDYDDDDEVPYEFQDGYLSEWYGTSDDEELQDAIDSDDNDDW